MRTVSVLAASVAREIYYIHTDHLNTPRLITNSQNQPVWRNHPLSEPFGAGVAEEDPRNTGVRFVFNMRFPGQYYDKETNTHYNYYRDYNPATGRYIQPDPIGLEGGINLYGYVGGNPVFYVDPLGLNPAAGAIGGGIIGGPPGAVIGAVVGLGIGGFIGNAIFNKPPENAYDPNGPKAPGKPSKEEGFEDPKGGENWVPNPNGKGWGWEDSKGNVWCPTGQGGSAHGGSHWDVQTPGGGYRNVRPRRQP
ncbi:MAG: hypothetical protein LBV29_00740 [Azoarcus sp.]|nr:hypothetical protein [Azoarcus sp.]